VIGAIDEIIGRVGYSDVAAGGFQLIPKPHRTEETCGRTVRLLAGKIQGILPISPVGSSQMAQNIVRITISHEKILGTLEQENLGLIRELNWEWQRAFVGVSWHLY
jgi:hypothetical protein